MKLKNKSIYFGIFVAITLLVTGFLILQFNWDAYAQSGTTGKYIILTFDDGPSDQYINAKPILDKYGYKATFFIVGNWVGGPNRMTWSNLSDMKNDGMDIESHTMTHPNMNTLTVHQLDYETGGAKKFFAYHGFNTTIFAYPRDIGGDNATVVKAISKYYDLAKTSDEKIWFLTCHGYPQTQNQKDCRTYAPNGNLQFANRYAIKKHGIDAEELKFNWNDTAVFNDIVKNWINLPAQYNVNGATLAVPIITFHHVDKGTTPSSWLHINQKLFDRLLGYLHNNGFQVLTMKDLGYNTSTNMMYLKGQTPANLKGTVLTLNSITWPARGDDITVTGKLVDQSGAGLGGKAIVFSGTGAAGLSQVKTNPDGTFSTTGQSPSKVGDAWNAWQVNAIFAGDRYYSANDDTQYYNTL